MTLPYIPPPKDTIVIGDDKVEVQGLSYQLILRLQQMNDPQEVAIFTIEHGCHVTKEEAEEFTHCHAGTVDILTTRILELSSVSENSNFQDKGESTS